MKRLYVVVTALITGIILFCWLSGFRLTENSSLPGNVQIINSDKTVFGRAVLFEDIHNHSFGVAKLEQYFGILFRYGGGSLGNFIEEGKPFKAGGIASDEKQDSFVVGVQTAKDSNIQYIVLGNHLEGLTPSDTYHLTLDEIKANSDNYHIATVVNNYALIVQDEYTENAWTIRAFDKKGNLIADQLFSADARYINW